MNDTYIESKDLDQGQLAVLYDEGVVPNDKYEVYPYTVVGIDSFVDDSGMDIFPLFEAKDDIFKEIPLFVWSNQSARSFLQQLAIAYKEKKNPSYSYTPIRVVKEDDFFVLEWIFQDKRFSFFFNETEDNKYSILYFNSEEKTFVNSVKKITPERNKEIAEEILSYIS